jgi:pimeloyl-ACP methyl ester carboxylesterase
VTADPQIEHRQVRVGDIELHVAELGEGPPVILCHGFPELWYSWRHQLPALAQAGYRAVAPDMRGYGGSSRPEAIEAYDVVSLTSDMAGLLDDLGAEKAAFVGHDWGSTVAWHMALLHPERVAAVAGLSVPIVPRAPGPPAQIMRKHLGEDFYIVWFQTPGEADAALARDVRRTLSTTKVWTAAWSEWKDDDPPRPAWLTEEDLDVYVEAFERTGFSGGLNWYRNLDRNWELTEGIQDATVDQPALFVTGSRDAVRKFMPAEAMNGLVTDLREQVVIEGAGHWIQQECADEVNAALVHFLSGAGY